MTIFERINVVCHLYGFTYNDYLTETTQDGLGNFFVYTNKDKKIEIYTCDCSESLDQIERHIIKLIESK